MGKIEHVACTRCGEKNAYSAEQLAETKARIPDFPPFHPGICPRCMIADPALKAEFDAWQRAYWKDVVGDVRHLLARPLEAIDRFVESLR